MDQKTYLKEMAKHAQRNTSNAKEKIRIKRKFRLKLLKLKGSMKG